MGIAGNALDLIRTVFNRDAVMPTPSLYPNNVTAELLAYGGTPIGPSSDVNRMLAGNVQLDQDLMSRYADYMDMDGYPEIGSAFDLYADDATVQDLMIGRSLWYDAHDRTIEKILNDMWVYNLRGEEDLWEIARSLCMNGNCFEELMVLDKVGVMKLNHMPAPTVRRIEDKNGVLHGFVQDPSTTFRIDTESFMRKMQMKELVRRGEDKKIETGPTDNITVMEPWEVVHFRLRGRSRKELYGVSIAEAARWVWKRLVMLEDAMVLYKLTRSPQRYAFYVDVGDVPPNQARAYVNKVKNDFKKTKYIDPATGKLSFRYHPLAMDEDLFIPVRKGKRGSEVEVLTGPEGQQVDDVNYFRDKLFTALKVPKSFLGMDETIGRANLAQQDVRYSRSVMRIQRELKNGYTQVARVDLSARNIDPDRVDFTCHMKVPSGVFELAQTEVQTAKLDLAERFKSQGFSEYYIWSTILGVSDEEIATIRAQRAKEQPSDTGGFEQQDRDAIANTLDRERSQLDPKLARYSQQIKDEITEGRTEFGRRMKELRKMVVELSYAVKGEVNKLRRQN